MAEFTDITQSLTANIEKVVIGKRSQIQTILAAVLARGHILLEDVPGTAKTMLARSLAISLGCDFKRVQCTPDLLPTDVTGVSIYNQKTQEFEFMRGPVFTNVLLADEINRATPRSQSSLLEAMEEKQTSVDGATYRLPQPFIVMATQNPVEQEGTFPLPEAQLDRFLVRTSLGYPAFENESDMLDRLREEHPIDALQPVISDKVLLQMQQFVTRVTVHPQVKQYLLQLVHATRGSIKLALAASPRASIALYRTAQAMAALEGRNYVTPDDVKALAVPVIAHRLILKPDFRLQQETTESVVNEILERIEVPTNVRPEKGASQGSPQTASISQDSATGGLSIPLSSIQSPPGASSSPDETLPLPVAPPPVQPAASNPTLPGPPLSLEGLGEGPATPPS